MLDKSFLNTAVQGQSVEIDRMNLYHEEKISYVRDSSKANKRSREIRNQTMVPDFLRDSVMTILKELQDIGIKNKQHIKRPYLFTGSWAEGITNIEQLYDRVKEITPNEAILRIYNIIQPHEGKVPSGNGNELAISHFYGEYFNFDAIKERNKKDLEKVN